jgi:heme/copper-type cytochrome/quinol oxidase subunit 3
MPGDSIWPAVVAAALLVLFGGILLRLIVVSAVGVALTIAATARWLWPSRETIGTHVPVGGRPRELPVGRAPGWWGMALLVATDATMFAVLLASYGYLGFAANGPWPPAGIERPQLALPLLGTAVLLASSAPVAWAEAGIKRGDRARLRVGLVVAMALSAAFLAIQAVEYTRKTFAPQTNAYGSAFFTVTSFHALHVVVALLFGAVLLLRASRDGFDRERHLAVQNVALYWHFVGAVWVFILSTMYLSPWVLG